MDFDIKKEEKRLLKLVERLTKQGVKFIESAQEIVSRETSNKSIKKIKTPDILKHGYITQPDGELISISDLPSKTHEEYVRKIVSRVDKIKQADARTPMSAEARSEAARRGVQTRREREASDREYAERMRKARSEAARRGAQTRREREASDPEYAERMRKARSEAARRGAQTRREREATDPEYAERMRKARSEAAKRGAETRRKKRKQIEESEVGPIMWDYRTDERVVLFENIYNIASLARNADIADYLINKLQDEITRIGEDVVLERFSKSPQRTLELFSTACNDSDALRIYVAAVEFLDVLLDGISPQIRREIADIIDESYNFEVY